MRLAGRLLLSALPLLGLSAPAPASAPPPEAARPEPFVVEFYYKVKWGSAQEWISLLRKNYLPILEADRKRGKIAQYSLQEPRYHATEGSRWDYRLTVVYTSSETAYWPSLDQTTRKQLFPDQVTFEREEKRRFELLDAHWDVPIKTGPFEAR